MPTKKDKKIDLLQTPKGMKDLLFEEYLLYQNIYTAAEELADYYGFSPIQTPHMEKVDLFTATSGDTSDVIEKQMYTLKTRGGDHLVLRPEGTAPIMRSYLENGMHTLPQPVMLSYKGSFFRHEKPQRGRLRELQQFGLEIIGEDKAIADAIIIRTMVLTLEELGLGPLVVKINSLGDRDCRNAYRRELVSYYRKRAKSLCKDCKRRLSKNPLRLLDCKEEKCEELKKDAPQMVNFLCSSCNEHFKEVIEYLESAKVNYTLDTKLVRGLDYYSRTVFEIFEDKTDEVNPPLALGGGGRYDYLAKSISNRNVPGVGGALGVDRIAMILKERGVEQKPKKKIKAFFIHLGTAARLKSLEVTESMRKAHIPMMQSIGKDSLAGQLRIASKMGIPFALILGQKEAYENSVIIRDMRVGTQETVPLNKLVEIIKKKI